MRAPDGESGPDLTIVSIPVEPWQLIAREQIRDTVTRYNSNGDAGRFDHVLDLFTVDAMVAFGGREYRGRDEIRDIFTGTQDRLRAGRADTAAPVYIRHFTATHQIDLASAAAATGRCYYAAVTPAGLDHWGRYLDEYRQIDGRWLIASRTIEVDGRAPTTALAG